MSVPLGTTNFESYNLFSNDTPARCFFMFQATEIHNGKYKVSHMTYQRRWNKKEREVPRQPPSLWPEFQRQIPIPNDDDQETSTFQRMFQNIFQQSTNEEVQMPGSVFYYIKSNIKQFKLCIRHRNHSKDRKD